SDLNNELNYITDETHFLVNKFMEKEDLLNNLTEGIKDNYEFYTRNITMNEINELYELKQDTYVTNLTFNEDKENYTVEGYTKEYKGETMKHAQSIIEQAEAHIQPLIEENKRIAYYNFKKVMQAFNSHSVMESDFTGTTGYGYDDTGRDKLEDIFRDVFEAEDALVRAQIISGTHAISLSLLSLLSRGDELLYITGWPYDTLEKVIGESEEDIGSMKELGIDFNYIDLIDDKEFDIDKILNSINDHTKV